MLQHTHKKMSGIPYGTDEIWEDYSCDIMSCYKALRPPEDTNIFNVLFEGNLIYLFRKTT